MKRSGALKRRTRLKPINPERKARETERAYGSPERVAWVASLPCTVPGCDARRCENAHVSPRGDPSGMGRKHDAEQIIPLCRRHHQELHTAGEKTFQAKYNLDLALAADVIACRWRER